MTIYVICYQSIAQKLGKIVNLKKSSKGDKKHKKEAIVKIALLEQELQERNEMKSTLVGRGGDSIEEDVAKLSMDSDQTKSPLDTTNNDIVNTEDGSDDTQTHVSKSQKKRVSDGCTHFIITC